MPDKPLPNNPPTAPPETPTSAPQSACPTMLMVASLEVDEPTRVPPPAAEFPPIEPHVPTLALSPGELPQAVGPSPEVPAGDASPAAAGDAEPEDDEGAIQRYMERLLHRVARIPEDRVSEDPRYSPPMAAHTHDVSNVPAGDRSGTRSQPRPSRARPVQAPGAPSRKEPETMPAAPLPAPLTPPEPVKPRSAIPPELAADLLAMRQLANRTVRRDVDRSDDRRSMVAAAGDITVASVCLASGVLASALGTSLLSAETVGGAIGIAFGMISLQRGLRTAFVSRRRRSEARTEGNGMNAVPR